MKNKFMCNTGKTGIKPVLFSVRAHPKVMCVNC